MRDEQIIIGAVLRELRLLGSGVIAVARLETVADAEMQARRRYGVSPGHVRAVVASLIRSGTVRGRLGVDEVQVRGLRTGRSRVSEKQEDSGQTGLWEDDK